MAYFFVRAFAAVLLVSLATIARADSPRPVGDIGIAASKSLKFAAAFSDEFDAPNVNAKKWDVDTEDFGIWSWDPKNTYQRDGSLHIQMVQETHQRDGKQLDYKSGIARTYATITYGYFEARVKGCARYPGASPAFWLHSKGMDNRHKATDGETVVYSEIDVIELQQSEFDSETKKHTDVTRIDCNLHAALLDGGRWQWIRPHAKREMCKNEYDAPWDPRDDYHVYGVRNTPETIIWYIDGEEIGRKPNLYWHLPMHVTLSLGLRYPFEAYKNGQRVPVLEETTEEGFPTTMSVDYVRVWADGRRPKGRKMVKTDMTKSAFIAMEEKKWKANGWPWNEAKVASNFAEIDTDQDGVATGLERQAWFKQKAASK